MSSTVIKETGCLGCKECYERSCTIQFKIRIKLCFIATSCKNKTSNPPPKCWKIRPGRCYFVLCFSVFCSHPLFINSIWKLQCVFTEKKRHCLRRRVLWITVPMPWSWTPLLLYVAPGIGQEGAGGGEGWEASEWLPGNRRCGKK